MEINASKIFNTAIILDNRIIEKYLIEEQKKSNFSPQVFFGLLLSHTKQISISKKIGYLKGIVEDLSDELTIFNSQVAPTLSRWDRESSLTRKTEKLEEAKSKAINYELFYEIVIRQLEISISTSESPPISEGGQPKEENPLENKFNTLDIEKVIKHFKPLTTKKIKDDPWMTDEDFDIFIRRSFCEEENLSKPKIKIGHGKKYAVVTLFYKFYEFCDSENYTENNKKEPYLSLLKGAFETTTFDNVILSNFKVKSKYSWN